MNNKASWQRSFLSFAGPGIHQPSDMMRVGESEALGILADLGVLNWQAPVYEGSGRHVGYRICNACAACCTALFFYDQLVGFYAGSSLWIAREHRRQGLSTPLILAAAVQRGGAILPPGVVVQGYTGAGLLAHRSAHSHAVLTAVAEGLPVPVEILAEIGRQAEDLAGLTPDISCLP